MQRSKKVYPTKQEWNDSRGFKTLSSSSRFNFLAPKNVFHQFIQPLRPLNSGQPSHQSKCLWPRVSTLTLFWALTISTGIGGWVDTPAPHVAEWQGEFEMPSSLWREKSTSFSKILEKTLCMAESRFLIYLLFMFTIKSNKNLQVF